jgi:hypothetical protein
LTLRDSRLTAGTKGGKGNNLAAWPRSEFALSVFDLLDLSAVTLIAVRTGYNCNDEIHAAPDAVKLGRILVLLI